MDKTEFDRYIEEMRAMNKRATIPEETVLPAVSETVTPEEAPEDMSGTGYLLVNVTSVRELYPVQNARVTVFKGSTEDMRKLAESVTDQSGKTELFTLSAPPRSLAEDSENREPTYAEYNILTEADGFLPTINMGAAVFDGVTSIQNVNLIPKTPYNENDSNIFTEENNYDL